jgi:hypothetical protein
MSKYIVKNSTHNPVQKGDNIELINISHKKSKGNSHKHIKVNKKQPSLRELVLKIDAKLDRVITLNNLKS